ncbi:metallophosphoesterase [Halomonas huangheensis]|uniref:Calcineurin-like phosphoesterase domain-containing protein n=1 Tax=Halomonas huangheensis TaxID=1178482 RepID=W1N2Q2_9GAMM|nr:metallophosphoesterase [Halomonas huangheensis]ALM52234.1 metallo-dependent phosphatase [Halomonas huangheensis]ERL49456.1 hypothetical protein BJB45_06660 [Halomonas huangheensis]
MRLHVLSDLHLEHFAEGREIPEVDCDVVVLAGDIHVGLTGLEWAAQRFADTPVIYVPGNHEFYQHRMDALRGEMRQRADELRIHLLDNNSVELQGVRFLGSTLWTDYALYDERPEGDRTDIPFANLSAALRLMPDYAVIEQPQGEVFSPEESVRLHRESLSWLRHELAQPHDGPCVVVTHHAPLPLSIPPRYRGDVLSPAFASDLEQLMGRAALWIHGHVHDPVDCDVHGTRVLCNPAGYPGERPPEELQLGLVVEVG